MSKRASDLLYAACNLKDMTSQRIDGTIHFDARPGNPVTITGNITGLTAAIHNMSIENECSASAN